MSNSENTDNLEIDTPIFTGLFALLRKESNGDYVPIQRVNIETGTDYDKWSFLLVVKKFIELKTVDEPTVSVTDLKRWFDKNPDEPHQGSFSKGDNNKTGVKVFGLCKLYLQKNVSPHVFINIATATDETKRSFLYEAKNAIGLQDNDNILETADQQFERLSRIVGASSFVSSYGCIGVGVDTKRKVTYPVVQDDDLHCLKEASELMVSVERALLELLSPEQIEHILLKRDVRLGLARDTTPKRYSYALVVN